VSAYLTDTPPDHDTVWGWLARNEPWVLGTMSDPVLGCLGDQTKAMEFAQRAGLEFIHVPAPPALRARGIPEAFAFPTSVLHDVFP